MSEEEKGTGLGPLDPGSDNPGFWIRFHARVMTLTQDELARRRAMADLSVAEVVFGWRKALVPAALLAAALAGVFVMTNEEPPGPLPPVALEEALLEDLGSEPIPTILSREMELDEVALMVAAGGF